MPMLNHLALACALLLCLVLTGCKLGDLMPSGLGKAEYSMRPFEKADGTIVCCEVSVKNGKDYKTLKVELTRDSEGNVTFTLDEGGVSASDPASVQAQQNAELLKLLNGFVDRLPQVAP